MRIHTMALSFLLVAAGMVPSHADETAPPTTPHFTVEKVAPGVFVAVSRDPLGLANHSNAVFIINDEDVVVVDTQFTLQRTREVLAALRKLTDKPVSVLVNTHWHDDHTFGNQVIVDAFPEVEILATEETRRDMAGIGVENRRQQVSGAPQGLSMFQSCIQRRVTVQNTPMTDDQLAAYRSTVAIMQEYLNDQREFHLTLPTKTFKQKLVLKRGRRTIELRHVGPGVTPGDAIVWLPEEGVLVAGDIVDNPLPFAYRCHVSGWIRALAEARALKPRIIVPGHGEVMHDDAGVQRLSNLLTSIRDQADAAFKRGDTPEQATAALDIKDLRGQIVGESGMLAFLFDGYFTDQVVASAFDEFTHP